MGRPQNMLLGERWGMGFISLAFVMGMISTAVWIFSQSLSGAPVGQMTSSEDNAEAGDWMFQPTGTSGIILSYSYQPWGGALSQSTELPCPRELSGDIAVRACRDFTASSQPREIPMKESQIKRIEKSLLSRNGPYRLKSDGMKHPLHRT